MTNTKPEIILTNQRCVACEGDVPPLTASEVSHLKGQLDSRWLVSEDNKSIQAEFSFKDFKTALEFVNKVGGIAEYEGHHPDIYLSWGKVKIELTTHAIKGLSQNDFILASKIDQINKNGE